MSNLFSYKPGTADIGMYTTNLSILAGVIIGLATAIKYLIWGGEVSPLVTISNVLVGVGTMGHGLNNFSQGFGMNRVNPAPPVIPVNSTNPNINLHPGDK